MNKIAFALSDHPILKPLVMAVPGLVFLFGLAIYGFPPLAWKVLAIEIVAIVMVSDRLKFSLAVYLDFALFLLLYLLPQKGRIGRHALILFPASTLIYHFYLLKKSPQAKIILNKRDAIILLFMLGWPVFFIQIEQKLSQRPLLYLLIYFFLSLSWKIILSKTGAHPSRLDGKGGAEAILILMSLGLGFIPLLSSLGAGFDGDSLWWIGGACLLFCLRLTMPKDQK